MSDNEAREYRKKPVVIEAMQATLENALSLAAWLPKDAAAILVSPGRISVHINTLEGVMVASEGDYIIQGVAGEFYPCKRDIFTATYEDAAKAVPLTIDREALVAFFRSVGMAAGIHEPLRQAVLEEWADAVIAHLSAREAADDQKVYAQGYLDGHNAAQEAPTCSARITIRHEGGNTVSGTPEDVLNHGHLKPGWKFESKEHTAQEAATEVEARLPGHWSNGDPVHLILDGTDHGNPGTLGRVAPNHNDNAKWVPNE